MALHSDLVFFSPSQPSNGNVISIGIRCPPPERPVPIQSRDSAEAGVCQNAPEGELGERRSSLRALCFHSHTRYSDTAAAKVRIPLFKIKTVLTSRAHGGDNKVLSSRVGNGVFTPPSLVHVLWGS